MIAACEGAKPESRPETTINYVTSSTNGKLPTINENVDIYHKMPSKGLVNDWTEYKQSSKTH